MHPHVSLYHTHGGPPLDRALLPRGVDSPTHQRGLCRCPLRDGGGGLAFCGAAGAGAGRRPGPGFRFPVKWWDSPPPSGNLEPANQYTPSKKRRES